MYNKLSFNSRFSQPHSHPALKSKVDTHILYHELLYVPFLHKYIHIRTQYILYHELLYVPFLHKYIHIRTQYILYHELLYVPFLHKYIHIHSTCLRANAVYGVAIILY